MKYKTIIRVAFKNGARLIIPSEHDTKEAAERAKLVAMSAFVSGEPEGWFHIDEGFPEDTWLDSACLAAFTVAVYEVQKKEVAAP